MGRPLRESEARGCGLAPPAAPGAPRAIWGKENSPSHAQALAPGVSSGGGGPSADGPGGLTVLSQGFWGGPSQSCCSLSS